MSTLQEQQENFEFEPVQEDQLNPTMNLVNAVADIRRRLTNLERMSTDNVEIKDTTGDYAVGNSWNGRRVLNTFDNTYKIFADGAWRSIVAY